MQDSSYGSKAPSNQNIPRFNLQIIQLPADFFDCAGLETFGEVETKPAEYRACHGMHFLRGKTPRTIIWRYCETGRASTILAGNN